MSYTKLFSHIVTSTIWRETKEVKIVWITLLALCNKHGEVMASIPGLADMARLTVPETEDSLKVLESPDQYSRNKDYDGRRLIPIDGGWYLVNYEIHRRMASLDEQREKNAERQRRWYDRHHSKKPNAEPNASNGTITHHNASITHQIDNAEAEAEAEAEDNMVIESTKLPESTDNNTIQTFLEGRLLANWPIPESLLKIFEMLEGDSAARFHADAVQKLNAYNPRVEVLVLDRGDGKNGKVDIVISDQKGEIGIELDSLTPRVKSLFKLQNHFDRWCVVLRQINPNGGNGCVRKAKKIADSHPSADFLTFWDEYPRRQNMKNAVIAWNRAHPKLDLVLDALSKAKKSPSWNRGNQFIPLPSTWINGERWDDEL